MGIMATTVEDIPMIARWIAADPDHRDDARSSPEFLLTGLGALAFKVVDDKGPLFFTRLDVEGDMLRLATQFGPPEEVSKNRLVTALLSTGIPAIINFAKRGKYRGIVFESTTESLIKFMDKQGFKPAGGDDYALTFEVNTDV